MDSLQSEIKELTKKQQDEIKRAKEHERLLAQSEITKRENQIKIVKEEMKSEIQKIRGIRTCNNKGTLVAGIIVGTGAEGDRCLYWQLRIL